MSLREKLNKMSEEISAEKEANQEAEQEKKLEPIRANIKKLEKEKADLEMIKNSLDFKSDDSVGMEEYSKATGEQKKKTRKQLEEIASDNVEALEKMGIKNVDELAENPDFAEDREIVAYKKALNQEADLISSDTKLKKRLSDLGIEINEDEFSYETASQKIASRLENLDEELESEKIKTPEGRAEIIDNLAEYFSQKTKNVYFKEFKKPSNEDPYNNYNFSLQGESFKMEADGHGARLSNYRSLNMVPKDLFEEQVQKYNLDIASTALKQAYTNKLEEQLTAPESPLGRNTEVKKIIMENFSYKKQHESEELLKSFREKIGEFKNVVDLKTEELKNKGIDFNAKKYFNQGGTAFIDSYKVFRGIYDKKGLFPPYNFNKVSSSVKLRIDKINQTMEDIKNINDEEGAKKFLAINVSGFIPEEHGVDGDNDPLRWHKRRNNEESNYSLTHFYEDGIKFNFQGELNDEIKKIRNNIPEENRRYSSDAIRYIDEKIAEAEKDKEAIKNRINELIDYEITLNKVNNENKTKQPFKNADEVFKHIEQMKKTNKESVHLLTEIAKIKSKLGSEELVSLDGLGVTVIAKKQEMEKINKEIEEKGREIQQKKLALNKEKKSEPWIGKGRWRNKISALEADLEKLEKEKSDLKSNYEKTNQESFHDLDIKEIWSSGGSVKEIFSKHRSKKMRIGEIVDSLEKELTKLSSETVVSNETLDDLNKLYRLERQP